MRVLAPIGILTVLLIVGCGNGDDPPIVGQNAPGTEAVSKAMDSPEMQSKLAARNRARSGRNIKSVGGR